MKTNCNDCPCLNNDADYGYSCNLDYTIESGVFGAISLSCGLVKIEFLNSDGKLETITPTLEKESAK